MGKLVFLDSSDRWHIDTGNIKKLTVNWKSSVN